jgi:hypothetical protein
MCLVLDEDSELKTKDETRSRLVGQSHNSGEVMYWDGDIME